MQDPLPDQRRPSGFREQWGLLFLDSQSILNIHVPDDEKLLFETSHALAQAWEKFQASLPRDQPRMYKDNPPSLKALYEAVNAASQTWTNKKNGSTVARLRQTFARLCISCDNHSHVLEMSPRNDRYVCLLTGCLTTIVQATINHIRIAEAISQSLEKLIADMAFWSEQMELYKDNAKLLEIMRELYIVIFEILTNVFNKWSISGWDRLLKSFDKEYFDREFESKRERIDELSLKLERQARLQDQKKAREMEMRIYEKFNALEKALILQAEEDNRLSTESSGSNSSLNYSRLASQGASMDSSRSDIEVQGAGTTFVYYKVDIIEALSFSGAAPVSGSISLMNEQLLPTFLPVDSAVLDRLQAWMRSTRPDNLWIQGPASVPVPSQNSNTARALVAAARNSDIPVIQCFLSDTIAEVIDPPNPPLSKVFERFLHGLLVQLAMLIPNSFTSNHDLSKSRLGKVMQNGVDPKQETSTMDYLLDILSTLRVLLPSSTICVLDGLQALEDGSDPLCTAYLHKFLDVLHHRDKKVNASGSGATVKLCFTTDGHVDALAEGVEEGKLEKIAYEHESSEATVQGTNNVVSATLN